tara:strand:+ start:752 stop:2176 length:1425 start_codon:yes stop_codon:yes gene_type:complete
MAKNRLGVIVPYRNRYAQLVEFKSAIDKYLKREKISYRLIIVEQDDAKLFNRGMLLNIGFKEAQKHKCNYVCFHDVDMIPSKVDYSYSENPVHLAHTLINYDNTHKPIFDQYFGGVTLFPTELFSKINGYSNDYWGWGFEDDDLLRRCMKADIPFDSKVLEESGPKSAALKLNGHNAHVEFNNVIDYTKDFTVTISFEPEHQAFDVDKQDDMFAAFGIPGFDFNIGYNSFNRFKIEVFNEKEEYFQTYSIETTKKKAVVSMIYNAKTKRLKGYLNGTLMGSERMKDPIYDYSKSKVCYLGCSDPNRETYNKFFKGQIDLFAIHNKALAPKELKSISSNQHFGLTSNFDDYESEDFLQLYYDPKIIKKYKLVDLTGNGNDGTIKHCEVVKVDTPGNVRIPTPFRRIGRFKLLKHDNAGFAKDSWQDINTRYNQLKFNNEIKNDWHDTSRDGLNNIKFRLYSTTVVENSVTLVVGV